MEQKKSNILPIISADKAVSKAIEEIDEGRTGVQAGLLCRWPKVNKVLLGSWRFNTYYVIGGMSGGGKSYFLNMLRSDFLNAQLNASYTKPFKIIHFAFEMSASDEILREVGGKVVTKYEDLISAYSRLSDDKYKETIETLQLMRRLDMDFVEVTGTVQQIEHTVMHYQGLYPQHQLVISLDHGLLTDYKDEASEIVLITALSKMFLRVRKRISAMCILISQLNAEIEDPRRISTPALHFPIKRDLHGAKAVYRDADVVMILHAPEKLNIQRYGSVIWKDGDVGYPTKDMIFNHILKVRKRSPGLIRFKADFANGNLIEQEKHSVLQPTQDDDNPDF